MATRDFLKDAKTKQVIYPITHTTCVVDNEGVNIDDRLTDIEEKSLKQIELLLERIEVLENQISEAIDTGNELFSNK